MAKFKKGDKVRVLDGSKIKRYFGTWTRGMNDYVGHEFCVDEIVEAVDRDGYYLSGEPYGYIFDERGLELVDDNKTPRIEIYAEGDKVVAKDINTGRTETCEYVSSDSSNFMVAAKLALAKLSEPRPVCKFKIGDRVIGNALATPRYGFTQEGWIGIVTETCKDDGLFRAVDIDDHDVRFTLNDTYFNLFKGVVPGDKAVIVDPYYYCTKDAVKKVCELTDNKEYLARFVYSEDCNPLELSKNCVFDVLAANDNYALITGGKDAYTFLMDQRGLKRGE